MEVRDDVHIAQVSRIVAATEIRGLFGCRALLLQFCVRDRESDLESQQRSLRSLQFLAENSSRYTLAGARRPSVFFGKHTQVRSGKVFWI
jgi:hypothetical protein